MHAHERHVPACPVLLVAASVMAGAVPLRAQAITERRPESTAVTGVVCEDRDGDGRCGAGEPGVPRVAVSDQVQVVTTDEAGRFRMDAGGYGLVFVSQPNGYLVRGSFWRVADGSRLEFALVPVPPARAFTFVHASDTHLSEASAARMRRLRELVDSLAPAFVIITGDLVRDALRVPEAEARGYFTLLEKELAQFAVPVFTVPGNHDKFGIERHRSLVSPEHPLYGNRMYRHYRGPDYYSFTYGGVHFLGLDTVDYEDLWYYGHVDDVQRAWMSADIAAQPAETRLVVFGHIPFVGAGEARGGFEEGGVAPSLIDIDGRKQYRHTVANHEDVLGPIQRRLEVALQGHFHMREVLSYRTQAGARRLITAAAVIGPAWGRGAEGDPVSGITLHRVVDGRVDDGTFLPLDPVPTGH